MHIVDTKKGVTCLGLKSAVKTRELRLDFAVSKNVFWR
jgi:hypothetical protein